MTDKAATLRLLCLAWTAAFGLFAAPAPAAVLPATPADLAAKIRIARPGDVVRPGPGRYRPLVLTNIAKASPGVVIRPAPGAVLTGVKLVGVSGLTLSNCLIDVPGAPKFAIEIRNFADVAVEDCEIRGPVVDQVGLNGVMQGVLARDGRRLRLSRNNIHNLRIGIGYAGAEDVRIEGNHIHDIAGDAIRGCGSRIRILGNRATNLFLWNKDHLDFVQFSVAWCDGQGGSDILIAGNDFRRGRGHQAQGVFMRGSATARYSGVVIENNGMVGTNFNGVFVSFADGVVVDNNFVQQDKVSNPTRIVVLDSTGVKIRGNLLTRDKLTVGRLEGFEEKGNKFNIAPAEVGDHRALEAWQRGQSRRAAPSGR